MVKLEEWGLETLYYACNLNLGAWFPFRYPMSQFSTEVVVVCPTPRSDEIKYSVDYCYLQSKIAPLVDLQFALPSRA
jgi:hypothetical protein